LILVLGGLGAGKIILIILIALLLFGPKKLPELGRAIGKTLREFKNGAKDLMSNEDEQPPLLQRQDIRSAEKHEFEGQYHEVSPIEKTDKAQDNRRLPE
jgi:sec-independent protein translocase protein TatA